MCNLYRSFSWYNISFDPYYNTEAKSDISLLILKTRKARPKEKLFPKDTQTEMEEPGLDHSYLSLNYLAAPVLVTAGFLAKPVYPTL